jgi:hypothetical protein
MRRVIAGVLACMATAVPAFAQSIRAADSLLEHGRLERAESLYYSGVRARPRDPVAREALGRYLAERGALRVAVTLLEEALQFGGDATAIGAELAPLYVSLGDYHALAALKSSALTAGERARATWLEAHSTRLIAPDSVLTVSFKSSSDDAFVGRMPVRINGRIVDAVIDASRRGIILSDSLAGVTHLRMFTEQDARRGREMPGVADSIGFGRLSMTNTPVAVTPSKTPVIVGLDVLARFAATFDPAASRATLRVSGTADTAPATAMLLSTLVKPDDWLALQANGWLSLRDPVIARLLREHRWTLDAKRGQLVLE